MTTEAATIDRIHDRAHAARPGRAALTILTAPLWLTGWIVGLLWLGLAYAGAAIAVGFGDAKAIRGNRPSGDG